MTDRPVILMVGSNRANLGVLSEQLRTDGYESLGVASMEELGQAIRRGRKPMLSLVDLSGFDHRIWNGCGELRKANIPYIVISPQRSPAVQRDSIKYGARCLVVKPVGVGDLLEYVRIIIGSRKAKRVRAALPYQRATRWYSQ